MIKVESLNKSINERAILKNINMNVPEGSIYGLIGPNGAGKTTLIKTLVDIYQPDTGTVLIDQENIHLHPEQKSKIGYVPDYLTYYANFTKKDLVKLYREVYPNWNEERYQKLNNLFIINDRMSLGKLSKGMKMQLAIHLNLSIMPKVLIMDEPTSGLDPIIRQEVLNLLVQEVSINNTTILISSHQLSELEKICDHIGFISQGEIMGDANLEEMKQQIKKYQVVFPQDIPQEIKSHKNVLKVEKIGKVYYLVVEDNNEDFINLINKYQPLILDTINMTLEEIFIYKMGGQGYELKNITF